jgi:hypothetical protein
MAMPMLRLTRQRLVSFVSFAFNRQSLLMLISVLS